MFAHIFFTDESLCYVGHDCVYLNKNNNVFFSGKLNLFGKNFYSVAMCFVSLLFINQWESRIPGPNLISNQIIIISFFLSKGPVETKKPPCKLHQISGLNSCWMHTFDNFSKSKCFSTEYAIIFSCKCLLFYSNNSKKNCFFLCFQWGNHAGLTR